MSDLTTLRSPFLGHGSIEQRTLDTLIRIEAQMERLITALVADPETTTVDGELIDVISDITPTETPFMTAVTDKPKRKGKPTK